MSSQNGTPKDQECKVVSTHAADTHTVFLKSSVSPKCLIEDRK